MEEEILKSQVFSYCSQLGIDKATFDNLNKDGVLVELFKVGVQVGMQTMYQQMASLPNVPKMEKPKEEAPRKNVTYETLENGDRRKITDCGGGYKVIQII